MNLSSDVKLLFKTFAIHSCSQLLFTTLVHNSCSQLQSTTLVQNSSSQILFKNVLNLFSKRLFPMFFLHVCLRFSLKLSFVSIVYNSHILLLSLVSLTPTWSGNPQTSNNLFSKLQLSVSSVMNPSKWVASSKHKLYLAWHNSAPACCQNPNLTLTSTQRLGLT